ncbi:MAG: HD domain-containing phosphohydrolase [Christensenellales bacterium]
MKLLIVDDSRTDTMMLCNMLREYDLRTAFDGVEAMALLQQETDVDIMILDINMPRMNGFEVLEAIGKDPRLHSMATLILTNYDEIDNEIRGLELGAVDYIRKPLNLRSLQKRIELHSSLKRTQKALEQHNFTLENAVEERTRELNLTRDVTIHALVGLLEIRDIESSNHTRRTQWMMKAICRHLQSKAPFNNILSEAYINELFSTAPLHDIGKVGIPDNILLKPGKLTPDEFEIMKKHTTYGVDALELAGQGGKELSFIRTALEIVRTHHERFDGGGYPHGLAGTGIPLAGRLMALVDVYDALVSKRVYKQAFPHQVAMDIVASQRGKQFDPDLVDAFFEIEEEIRAITERFVQGVQQT